MKIKLLSACVLLVMFVSCKKEKGDSGTDPGTVTATKEEKLMDSVYLFTKEVYFWNTLIPEYNTFNPRQYKAATPLESAQNIIGAIRKLQPNDRFSFATTIEESDGIQTGQDKDYGFFIKAAYADLIAPYDSAYWYVSYVYNQSTAGAAGVKRGWIVNKINGTTVGYNNAGVTLLNNTFFGTTTSASFEFLKPDASTQTSTLSKTSFQANSVLFADVFTRAGSSDKVGYLVFNQFFGASSRAELGTAFTAFQSQGITDLIVDLRYNPGGSTETQDTLANLIAPLAANNQKMYTYQFNETLKAGNFPLLKTKPGFQNVSFAEAINTVNFKKAGTLNLTRVFFIVSGSSASASELLMNNLKPYMSVKIIGDTTYGKPVGFFPIEIGDVAIYPISFRTINSAGNADYYTGFAPDKLMVDGVNKDWGDSEEPCLATAFNYIINGTFGRTAGSDKTLELRLSSQVKTKATQRELESKRFSGMFKEK